jgi:hypothetical protein
MKKKNKTLVFIQVAWPIEVIALILFTMIMVSFNHPSANLWMQAIGPLSLLIGAQGGAASIGPAVKDIMDSKDHKAEEK